MNNATMRRLGDYIRKVDVRNRDLKVTRLVGVNLDKEFMPSVANTVGTDMATYKIVSYNQFGCKLMSVERDRKMPISLMKDQEPALISSAYYVFEVLDENILDPDFLFLQIKSPEFDRRLWFSSGGDVRGGVGFDNLADMPITVPPIEEQREIVARHKAIEHKIDVNRRLIAKLEETARTIYRHTFVEDIDPENLPTGWEQYNLSELVESNDENLSSKDKFDTIRYYETSSVTNNVFEAPIELILGEDEIPSRAKRKVKLNDIIYSTVRPNLRHYGLMQDDSDNNIVSTGFAVLRSKVPFIKNEFIFLFLTMDDNTQKLQELADMSKATYPSITIEDILNLSIILPAVWTDELVDAQDNIVSIFNNMRLLIKDNELLNKALDYEHI